MADIEVLFGLNVCNPDEEEKCRQEIGNEELLKWSCEKCEKKKVDSIHPWTNHLLVLRRLVLAGYPFKRNDLSIQEWLDLGFLNEAMAIRMKISHG